ncbi:MAG: MlaD family protein [Mycobacteriales bacterium]|nr:MlaD family protein [Mycobacteriales bacterium]
MITRQTKIQLLVFALIAAVGLSYTGLRYAGLGRYFVDQGYLVSADFVDSGGIFKGAEVTYRGVPTGKVEELELREDGVRVVLRLEPGTKVPDSVKAVVGNRSAVGEQYVDLLPTRDGAPFLPERGAVIPQSMTAIPIAPTTLLVNLDRLVTSIDTDELATVLDELGQAFDGAGDSLQRLVDAGDALTQAATDSLPETITLIDDGKTALDTQRDVAGDFRSFNADLADVAAQLRASDPDFRKLFQTGTDSAEVIDDLLEANRSALPVLLANLVTVAQVQKIRIPAIKQILVTYPNVVAGGFTVVPGDGTSHFGLVLDSDPPTCTAGYETTKKRDPSNVTLQTPNLNAYCAVKDGSTHVRGTQNAPRPAGQQPFPDNGGPYPTTSSSGAAASSSSSRPPLGSVDSVLLGDYDPVTGSVVTDDGQRLTVGSSGGASQMLGSDSWQWLLLGPLSS